jgi:hypothetical protein
VAIDELFSSLSSLPGAQHQIGGYLRAASGTDLDREQASLSAAAPPARARLRHASSAVWDSTGLRRLKGTAATSSSLAKSTAQRRLTEGDGSPRRP